jgi:hypothetical protein
MPRLRSWAQINRDVADFKEQLSQSCPESLVLLVTDTPSQPLAAMSICEFGGIRLTLPLRLVLARGIDHAFLATDPESMFINARYPDCKGCDSGLAHSCFNRQGRFIPLAKPAAVKLQRCARRAKRAPRVSVRSLIDETSGAGDTHRIAASAPFSPDENATFAADLAALLDNKRLHQLGIFRNKGSIVGAQHSGGRSCDRIFYRPGARR